VEWNEIETQLQDYLAKETPIRQDFYKITPKQDWGDIHEPYYTEQSSVIRHFIRQQGKRTLQWLQQHGRCADHMRPGKSSIPHAGRGAFATRSLPKGSTVGYAPLVHVGTQGNNLYNIPYQHGTNSYSKLDLIYNYAFGHLNSTIILNPYGSMVNYINHAPADQANVRVVWPTEEMVAHVPAWLHKDPGDLNHILEKIGLSLDYVALRDIAEGDEILMDYGPAWEYAWQQHVATWTPPADAEQYVHSTQFHDNEEGGGTAVLFRTRDELQHDPYPINLHTLCLPSYYYNATGDDDSNDNNNGKYYYLVPDRDYIDRTVCHVLQRYKQPQQSPTTDKVDPVFLYTVELVLEANDNDNDNDNNGNDSDTEPRKQRVVVVHDFPSNAIWLTDRIMTQDWHLPNTFRHYIQLPDDILPDAWKNKPESTRPSAANTAAASMATGGGNVNVGGDSNDEL
jgi:hypothetical protein